MIGEIVKIEEKEASTGKKFWTVTYRTKGDVKNHWANTFENMDTYKVGDIIEFDISQNGPFRNMRNVRKMQQIKTEQKTEKAEKSDYFAVSVRNTALTASIQLACATIDKENVVALEDVINTAKAFEEYLRGDDTND